MMTATTKVSDLFLLQYGHSLELNSLELSTEADAVNFVGRAARRNGVTARVKKIVGLAPAPAGSVTVALGGQGGAGMAFLQPFPFYCGRDVMILTPKSAMAETEILWWTTCISANRFRFGFGRQANKSLSELSLPSAREIPGWVSTTDLELYAGARSPFVGSVVGAISTVGWSNFRYDDLFHVKKGKRLTKAALSLGKCPFIGAIEGGNGYRQFVSAKPNHEGNTITVNYNGSVAEAFYQPQPYWASDDVNVLYPKFALNCYIAMFICTLIKKEKYRFSYGRKWHVERMTESLIRLPITDAKQPDWKFMESYIKSLPYSKSI